MALNADEKKLLAELQARESAPEEDEDFEIEVYDTAAGRGARIPFSKGKGWLFDTFGIGDAPAADTDQGDTGQGDAGGKQQARGYFGRQQQQK